MNQSGIPFPPQTQHLHDVALLTEAFAAVVADRTAWYVSSPLTSGLRSRHWLTANRAVDDAGQASSEDFIRHVVALNRTEAATFVQALRSRERHVVIDPTALEDVPGWTQSDYRVLWAKIIQRYVETVVFRDGWQHSNGCAWEFLTAWAARCLLLREDLSPMSVQDGRSLLEASAAEQPPGASKAFLTAVLKALATESMEKQWRAPR